MCAVNVGRVKYHFLELLFSMWTDIWNVSCIELRILKSSKLWSSQLWTQFKQLRIEAWKSQDFNFSARVLLSKSVIMGEVEAKTTICSPDGISILSVAVVVIFLALFCFYFLIYSPYKRTISVSVNPYFGAKFMQISISIPHCCCCSFTFHMVLAPWFYHTPTTFAS